MIKQNKKDDNYKHEPRKNEENKAEKFLNKILNKYKKK